MGSNRTRILFLIFVVLGVYYPVIFAGVNSVDDSKMLLQIAETPYVDWKGLFMPGAGYYYRPLLMLSYMGDKMLWDLSESFMHLENLLIHAANSVLVFLLALRLFARYRVTKLELPLLSALLFALHPINTEPVAWISGRSDPLATLFVLLSVLVLAKGLDENRYSFLALSNLLLLLGCMVKEVAVFFLPAVWLITLYWPKAESEGEAGTAAAGSRVKQVLVLMLPAVSTGLLYLGFRFLAYGRGDSGLLQIVKGNGYELADLFRVFFKVFGFYVKKLFLPLPLNFAIVKVDDNYVWLGIAAFLLLVLLAFRRNIFSAFVITACYLISPAVLVAVSRIAWTPFAERYLYLSSAFFAVGMVGLLYLALKRFARESWLLPSLALLLLPAAVVTAQRVLVWQDNLLLYQDTLKKSPDFISLRNELAIALMVGGKSDEANRELEAGKKLDPARSNVLLYVNQAKLKLQAGEPDQAREVLLPVAGDKKKAGAEVLKMLALIDEKRLFHAKGRQEYRAIYREIMDTHDHLYVKTGNTMSLYRGGQMALFLGENEKAAAYFQEAYDKSPDGTYFKPAAKKLAERLRR